MKLLKKMSAATLIGKIPTRVVEIKSTDDSGAEKIEKVLRGIEQPLMRVIGLATGVKTGITNFGTWFAFTGQFQATNILTGELARSANLFLPESVTELLVPTVKAAGETGVEFAFDIGVRPFNNAQGYEYTVNHLIAVQESDPLQALSMRLLAEAPALPAPQVPQIAPPAAQAEIETETQPEVAHGEKHGKKK